MIFSAPVTVQFIGQSNQMFTCAMLGGVNDTRSVMISYKKKIKYTHRFYGTSHGIRNTCFKIKAYYEFFNILLQSVPNESLAAHFDT